MIFTHFINRAIYLHHFSFFFFLINCNFLPLNIGVEEVEIDEKNHKVMVKGKKVDPLKVAKRLRKKSGKYVELISPIPLMKKEEEEKKETKQEVIIKLKKY